MNALVNQNAFTLPASALATVPHFSRSEKTYSHVNTSNLIPVFTEAGFELESYSERKVRLDHKRGFQTHIIRMRHSGGNAINGAFPQVIIKNSHDGTSGLVFLAGLRVMACLNGIVAASTQFAKVSLHHRGQNLEARSIEAAASVMKNAIFAAERIEQWEGITLSHVDRLQFAAEALKIRYQEATSPIEPFQILYPFRQSQASHSLWDTFNTIQESIMRGGMIGRNAEGKRRTLRAIRGAEKDISFNSDLYKLAEKFAEAA